MGRLFRRLRIRLRRRWRDEYRRLVRLGRAIHLVWESAAGWTVANGLILLVQGVLPLASLYFTKLILDRLTEGVTGSGSVDFSSVGGLIVAAALVMLGGNLIGALGGLIQQALGLVVTDHVYDVLHAKSVALDLEYYENAEYYDRLHRAQQEAPYRPTQIVSGLMGLGQNVVSLAAMGGLLLSLHWGIVLLLVVTAVPGIVVRLRYANVLFRWRRERTAVERETRYFDWMLIDGGHAKEVRLFELGPLFIDRFRTLRRQLRHEQLRIAVRRTLASLGMQLVSVGLMFGVYAFLAYRALEGQITVGDVVMYNQAFQRGRGAMTGLMNGLAAMHEHGLFLTNLYEFLDLKPKVADPAQPRPVPHPMQRGFRFENVSFQYPTGTRPVLHDIDLAVEPGQVVALVGQNGAGKTTLIKLLCRLYDPDAGRILLDDTDLRAFSVTDLRRTISVVFQDYVHYNLSAQENIWFGNVVQPLDPDRVRAAAQQAGADRVIERLDGGYASILGKLFQDGEQLSIGEWQKVSLARAFMRDAQLIVLDEPTSALDAEAEHEVFTRFRELIGNRAAVVISHRLSTVKLADCIYVLDGGRVVEHGTHAELVALDGTYARLFELQAQYYR